MKHLKTKLLSLLLTMSASTFASDNINEYHFENNLGYSYSEGDYAHANVWGTSLSYYWNPISYSNNQPNQEVEFIDRLGSVTANYSGYKTDGYFDRLFNNLGIEMIYADKDSDHVFQFNYQWRTTEETYQPYYYDNKLEFDTHNLHFGYDYYLKDNLTIGANFNTHFFDSSYPYNADSNTYNIHSKYLMDLGNQQWLSLIGEYEYKDYENTDNGWHTVGASAEYYFTPKTSLKLEGNIDIPVDEYLSNKGTAGISATHYFVDQFALYAEFDYFFASRGDSQAYTIGMNFRF